MASPVWMPILTRIGGAVGERLAISRWIACAQATARRALGEGEHRSVALGLDDGAAVRRGDLLITRVVPADDLDPGVVAEPGQHDGRVDDVREHDRDRAIDGERGERSGFSRWTACSSSSSVTVNDLPETSTFGRRERPVHVHDLPLAVLEVEDVASRALRGSSLPVDRLLHARPPDGPFFPGVDLVGRDQEGTPISSI